MISNYIFKLMAGDGTDSTANDQLPAVKARMGIETLTADKLPPFVYTSLKSLLGETANSAVNAHGQPQWAVNRIFDTKNNQKFRKISDPDDYPFILMEVQGLQQDQKAENTGRDRGRLELLIRTNPDVSVSSNAYNIMQRVLSLFKTYTSSGIETHREIVDAVSGVIGLASLRVHSPIITLSAWDIQRATLQIEAVTIR